MFARRWPSSERGHVCGVHKDESFSKVWLKVARVTLAQSEVDILETVRDNVREKAEASNCCARLHFIYYRPACGYGIFMSRRTNTRRKRTPRRISTHSVKVRSCIETTQERRQQHFGSALWHAQHKTLGDRVQSLRRAITCGIRRNMFFHWARLLDRMLVVLCQPPRTCTSVFGT